MNPVKHLTTLGQAIWLDAISRGLLTSGELERMTREDGVSGVTSNPAIFEKAIAGSDDYNADIAACADDATLSDEAVYERLAIADIQAAADVLRPTYHESDRLDGYVSLEVSPRLAHDTEATVAAAKRLWQAVDRPNLMIKVPATPAGLPAIEQLVMAGLNLNITLLFSISTYEEVAEHYLRGLEQRLQAGLEIGNCASVASFFLSRIDSAVDDELGQRLANADDDSTRTTLQALQGKAAIASARLAYQRWKSIFSGPRWQALQSEGAYPQRLLWASTSTKNPAYDDVRYVAQLVGPHTVNTVPPATLDAYRDHGDPQPTLENDLTDAEATLAALHRLGIDLDAITDDLLTQGLVQFDSAYERVIAAVSKARG